MSTEQYSPPILNYRKRPILYPLLFKQALKTKLNFTIFTTWITNTNRIFPLSFMNRAF